MIECVIIFGVILAIIGLFYIEYIDEYEDWNNGHCPKCGKKMEYCGKDSIGYDNYVCSDCGYHKSVLPDNIFYIFWKKWNKNKLI